MVLSHGARQVISWEGGDGDEKGSSKEWEPAKETEKEATSR